MLYLHYGCYLQRSYAAFTILFCCTKASCIDPNLRYCVFIRLQPSSTRDCRAMAWNLPLRTRNTKLKMTRKLKVYSWPVTMCLSVCCFMDIIIIIIIFIIIGVVACRRCCQGWR
jgi:hypothetical protein